MKNTNTYLVLCVILTVIAGCLAFITKDVWSVVGSKPTVRSTEKISIANIGEYSLFHLIAKEKGYFKDNGLDADVLEYPSGPPAIQALLEGKVDFAAAAEFVGVSNIFTNPHLRILAGASSQEVFEVIGRKDKGIIKPADLKGKRVAVTRKGVGEFFLGRFLSFNDLSFKDITVVDLQPQEMITQIQSGKIDAVVVFSPHTYTIEKALGNNAIWWSAQGEQKAYALLYTTDDFIQEHPDTVINYMHSMVEAEQFFKNNNQESQAILANSMHYQDSYSKYIWPKLEFSLTLDQSLLLALEDQARFIIKNKLTKQTVVPNYLNYIYFKAMDTVKPAAITIIR